MFTVLCKKACAEVDCCRPLLTTGMSKSETVEFIFSPDWAALTKTAVFTDGTVTVDVLQSRWHGNTVTVPAEVLTTAGRYVRVGVYGTGADGVALPTIWADLGKVRPGAEPSGDASTDPSLPVWAQLQALIGDLDDLTTKAKDNLVAAINEAAKTGSGGSGSIDLRVAGGYIQYSNDGGATWENLIALADLKGDDGAPGTPGAPGKDGTNGQDGYSPSASVSETDTGATITITDKTGTTTAEIKNGKDGKDGAPGKDGTNGKDGSPGAKGDPGATPNLQIGTVTTLPAGSDATASMGGTTENPVLNLGIPKGADGASGSSTITTSTETDIAGLLMGEGGKVRKAIPDVDYLKTKELPTPEGDEYNGSYLRWYQGVGWTTSNTDTAICEITENNGQYYCDRTPSSIQTFANASQAVFAIFSGEPYLLTSLSNQSAVFTRVAGTTVETFTVSADYTAVRATATIPSPETKTDGQTQPVGVDANGKLWTQPGGGASGGTDISLGVTGAAVGQIAKITSVDADGKPTAWEPVDMPSGGSTVTWHDDLLAEGTIITDTAVNYDLNVTLAKLREYRTFLYLLKGASNTDLSNLYLRTGNNHNAGTIDRGSSGGRICVYEWADTEKTVLRKISGYSGNPSIVALGKFAKNGNSNPSSDIGQWNVVSYTDLSSHAETEHLYLTCANTPTIDYAYQIRGLTK